MIDSIFIKSIPMSEMRYKTCGDWWYDPDGTLQIRAAKMGDWRYELLIKCHELFEVAICCHQGVSQKSVDHFDIAFEKKRKPGNVDEPGDSEGAPYSAAHCAATGIERILAFALGVKWCDYGKKVDSLWAL